MSREAYIFKGVCPQCKTEQDWCFPMEEGGERGTCCEKCDQYYEFFDEVEASG